MMLQLLLLRAVRSTRHKRQRQLQLASQRHAHHVACCYRLATLEKTQDRPTGSVIDHHGAGDVCGRTRGE